MVFGNTACALLLCSPPVDFGKKVVKMKDPEEAGGGMLTVQTWQDIEDQRFPSPKWMISSPIPANVKRGGNRMWFMMRLCLSGTSGLTLAFWRTLPLVLIIEVGLLFSAEAELTGEAGSALWLLHEFWDDEDDDDDGDGDDRNDDDVWGVGRDAVLVWG